MSGDSKRPCDTGALPYFSPVMRLRKPGTEPFNALYDRSRDLQTDDSKAKPSLQSSIHSLMICQTIRVTYTSWLNRDSVCGTLPLILVDDRLSWVRYVRMEKLVGSVRAVGVDVNDKPLQRNEHIQIVRKSSVTAI